MRIWETVKKIFTLPDLRKRIIFAIALLLLTRVLAHIPLPGVDLESIRKFFTDNQIFGLLNMFSGGSMENFSIILMGVAPYITSSIIMQLLTMVIPALGELNKEGEAGRAKINYWTRLITVPLALIQSYSMIRILQGQEVLGELQLMQWLTILISISAGTIFLMWLGELISENGIGNGISLIIALGILAGIPQQIGRTLSVLDTEKTIGLIVFGVISIGLIALIIMANEGTRQIPVSYARRVRGLRSYGGVDTHLPIRVNSAGVIPIIFALSMLVFPGVVAQYFQGAKTEWLANAATWVANLFNNMLFRGIIYFLLVVGFTFFYMGVIFKPEEMADNLQKRGGFIPGVRPGTETAQFLQKVIVRLTLSGAVFLGVIAILPFIVESITKITTIVLGGTGALILVSVIIETMRQIQAQLLMRTYENY